MRDVAQMPCPESVQMSLSKTISRLKRGREAFATAYPPADQPATGSRLKKLTGFRNPGNLRGLFYMPEQLQQPAPLLVVLHGCTQNAAGYDRGAGWSRLADRHGFALLYPEQRRENNPNLCFNWYQRSDAVRGGGEAASIAGMIEAMQAQFPVDGDRIYVTGLSAGGAMTSVMLATYPELFAGGAIIAGLPYGCAGNLSEAFQCMSGSGFGNAEALARTVRSASDHEGPWPRVSIWHGSVDGIVVPANADAIVKQWTRIHGVQPAPDRIEHADGHPRLVWTNAQGEDVIEFFRVEGMAHGTPLMPGTDIGESGKAQPHMLDVGLSSTDRIAAFFGIGPKVAEAGAPRRKRGGASGSLIPGAPSAPQATPGSAGFPEVQKTIEDALRNAGLLK